MLLSLRKVLFFALLFICSANAFAARSVPCAALMQEAAVWGIELDRTLSLELGPAVRRAYYDLVPAEWRMPSFEDVLLRVSSEEVAQIAQSLSLTEGDVPGIEGRLRDVVASGQNQTSLIPFLPERVQARLGSTDHHSCYYGAFNFHEDWSSVNPGISLDATVNLDSIFARYTMLGYGATLRFGDVLLFRRFPNPGNPMGASSFHAAVYIGGDIIYQKYSPLRAFHYEFTTLQSLMRLYTDPSLGAMQNLMARGLLPGAEFLSGSHRYGEAFVIQFLRYDPQKQLPEAASNPNIRNVPAPDHSVERIITPPYVPSSGSMTVSGAARSQGPIRSGERIGRNDPCPCGSGKKFKKCHGQNR